jgi:sulfite reductase alpha subunit-like flavoprotein
VTADPEHARSPPCARFYATLRRKSQPAGLLAGVAFTGFGLGDSNYTRYQHVPRAIRQRLQDLGAAAVRPVPQG